MNSKLTAIYYLLLLLFMLLWTSRTDTPMILRTIFFVAVMIPGINNRHGLLLAALTFFWIVSTYGYAISFMPTMTEFYVAAAFVAIITFRYKSRYTYFGGGNYVIPFLLILTCVRNIWEGALVDDLVYILILLLLTHYLLPSINNQTINYFQMSFMSITLILALSFLAMRDRYIVPDEKGIIGWTDQNYFGMVIGMGASIGVANLFRFKELSKIIQTMTIASICLSVPVLLMLASRGAVMCLVASGALILLMSTSDYRKKLLIIASVVSFLYYLYTNEYFDLLEERIKQDDGTGSQRLTIWTAKWNAFFLKDSLWELLFGVSRQQGLAFGATNATRGLGFHNDFLAFFVSYGVMGLSLFVTLLTQPLRDIRRHSPYRIVIMANIAYLVAGSITLEPFFYGYFPFYAFLLYTMLLTRVNNKIINRR